MKNKIVLDSCVFIKLFLQEHDHLDAVDLITELSQRNYQVLAPSLIFIRSFNCCRRESISFKKKHIS